MDKWKYEDNYIGKDYSDYYVLLGRNRDSNLLDNHNFDTALNLLGDESEPNVIVARSAHWLVGWVECILIHEGAEHELTLAKEIEDKLNNYPILDEDSFNDMLDERADEIRADVMKDLKDGRWYNWFHKPNPTEDEIDYYSLLIAGLYHEAISAANMLRQLDESAYRELIIELNGGKVNNSNIWGEYHQ